MERSVVLASCLKKLETFFGIALAHFALGLDALLTSRRILKSFANHFRMMKALRTGLECGRAGTRPLLSGSQPTAPPA